ncbi:MAG: hypothetical protein RLZZ245_1881, partial [Verrucomicrobiota bacterium]
LYAQQGYGTGTDKNDRITAGLAAGYIQGAIISPKDFARDRAVALMEQMQTNFPDADRLFDPQWYASILAHDPDCRMGKLVTDDYSYFEARRRSQLESEAQVRTDLEQCLSFQAAMPVTAAIAPGIVIRQRFNSNEAVIAKNFVRNARQVWNAVGDERPLYVTLAMDAEALQDRHALEEFLAEITILDASPDGFYLLVHNTTSGIAPELVDPRTLAGWMLMNHSLSLNGFKVINGYSDILTPFLAAAGGSAGATGWFNTQKVFSLDRFSPPSPGGRRPVYRYLSTRLLNSIKFDELQMLRGRFPEILNGLDTDRFYAPKEGSLPDSQLQEILQTWESISSFSTDGLSPKLSDCRRWIETANQQYEQINFSPGMRLTGRSNGDHLDSLRDGLKLFAELAEIDF